MDSVFWSALHEMADEFHESPFQYSNEDSVVPELYHKVRSKIDDCWRDATFERDYPDDIEDEWRVRDMDNRLSNEDYGEVLAVRREASFIEDGERWAFQNPLTDSTTHPDFDLVIFGDGSLIIQSKQEGPGEFWDVRNDVEVLCEVKHSKNTCGTDFYRPGKGATDVCALGRYPGSVEQRVFVFFDWWPVDGNKELRFCKYKRKLEENIEKVDLPHPVEIVYIPRKDRLEPEETNCIQKFTLS